MEAMSERLLSSIYEGKIYILRQSKNAAEAAKHAKRLYELERGSGDSVEMRRANSRVLSSVVIRYWLSELVREVGLGTEDYLFDPPVFRCIEGQECRPHAAFVHRDTWYAAPAAQINWWIAVNDLSATEGIGFFPALFDTPVLNDSSLLNYSVRRDLTIRGQFNQAYNPYALAMPDGHTLLSTALRAGDALIFSANHLHGSLTGIKGKVRQSLDFRTVNLRHYRANVGAKICDVACEGSSASDLLFIAGTRSGIEPPLLCELIS